MAVSSALPGKVDLHPEVHWLRGWNAIGFARNLRKLKPKSSFRFRPNQKKLLDSDSNPSSNYSILDRGLAIVTEQHNRAEPKVAV